MQRALGLRVVVADARLADLHFHGPLLPAAQHETAVASRQTRSAQNPSALRAFNLYRYDFLWPCLLPANFVQANFCLPNFLPATLEPPNFLLGKAVFSPNLFSLDFLSANFRLPNFLSPN